MEVNSPLALRNPIESYLGAKKKLPPVRKKKRKKKQSRRERLLGEANEFPSPISRTLSNDRIGSNIENLEPKPESLPKKKRKRKRKRKKKKRDKLGLRDDNENEFDTRESGLDFLRQYAKMGKKEQEQNSFHENNNEETLHDPNTQRNVPPARKKRRKKRRKKKVIRNDSINDAIPPVTHAKDVPSSEPRISPKKNPSNDIIPSEKEEIFDSPQNEESKNIIESVSENDESEGEGESDVKKDKGHKGRKIKRIKTKKDKNNIEEKSPQKKRKKKDLEKEDEGNAKVQNDAPPIQEQPNPSQVKKKFDYETERPNPLVENVTRGLDFINSYKRRTVNFVSTLSFEDPNMNYEELKNPKQKTLFPNNAEDLKGKIMGVKVLKSDVLRNVIRPFVRVTFIDVKDKKYLQKEIFENPVSNAQEYVNTDKTCHYILPQIIRPCNMMRSKSLTPIWNETLLYNEEFLPFFKPRSVVIFEIIDVIPEKREEKNIAWGFLKLVNKMGGANVKLGNVTHNARKLNLYYFPKMYKKKRVLKFPLTKQYLLFSSKNKRPYPSALYVELTPILRPEKVVKKFPRRSQNIFENEIGTVSFSKFEAKTGKKGVESGNEISKESQKKVDILRKKLRRKRSELCKIPDKPLYQFESGALGCLRLEFSHSGRLIACGCCGKKNAYVKIFNVFSGKLFKEFHGHLQIIYDITWEQNDREVMSASQDGTVRIWNIDYNDNENECLGSLQHPCFVYCSKYLKGTIVTGGYDGKIRIWNRRKFTLLYEYERHKSRINSIIFDNDKTRMFVADGNGIISLWSCDIQNENENEIVFIRPIKNIIKSSLTCIRKHPKNSYLFFIHSQDNTISCLDINQKKCIAYYTGVKCFLNSQKSNVSPDNATYVVTGSSEDGKVYFWHRYKNKLINQDGYDYGFGSNPVYDIAWSKKEHVIALCSYGNPEPIRLWSFEKDNYDLYNDDDDDDIEEDKMDTLKSPKFGKILKNSLSSTLKLKKFLTFKK